jgi:exonuclease VII small subunit
VVLLAFLVGLTLALVAGVFAALRAVGLWRHAKRAGGTFARELGSFEQRSAATERHLAEWERAGGDLEVALARLRASRARLQVLQDALAQAQARVRWLRVFLPGSN